MDKPLILFEGEYDDHARERFFASQRIWRTVDLYEHQVRELWAVRNPNKANANTEDRGYQQFVADYLKPSAALRGNWAFFPWNGHMVHLVGKNEYREIRTNRNRDLITQEEQSLLLSRVIAVAGLSVGNAIALTLAYQGIGGVFKIADHDTFETSNANRVRFRFSDVGLQKVDVTAHQLYECDPYSTTYDYDQGVTNNNFEQFIDGNPKTNLIVDEIDDFIMKVRIRDAARSAGTPVFMCASVHDRIIVDIERYDLDRSILPFNGILGPVPDELRHRDQLTEEEKHAYSVRFVTPDLVSERAMASVRAIGRTLVGRPQLAGTVTTASGFAAYCARRILLGDKILSGRYVVNFDQLFNRSYPL